GAVSANFFQSDLAPALSPLAASTSPSLSTAAGSPLTATDQILSAIGCRCRPTIAQAMPALARPLSGWNGTTRFYASRASWYLPCAKWSSPSSTSLARPACSSGVRSVFLIDSTTSGLTAGSCWFAGGAGGRDATRVGAALGSASIF